MASSHDRYDQPYPMHDQTQTATPSQHGVIQYEVDMNSGSSEAARRRRKNANSSRVYRNRIRESQHTDELIQSLTKQLENCQREQKMLMELNRSLEEQRDHYRKERNFFTKCLLLYTTEDKIPSRPPTPPLYSSEDAGRSGISAFIPQNPR